MSTAPGGSSSPPLSPAAPGGLGTAPAPEALHAYLGELDAWLRVRRAELDEIDAAAMASGRGPEVAGDVALALALWKAIDDRYDVLWAAWDGGRVLERDRERIAALIWGRLESGAGAAADLPAGLAVALPEAGRLCDALTAQLRTRLSLVADLDEAAARLRGLRAQLERVRDQVGLEPATTREAAAGRLAGLLARVDDAAARAERGADVTGLLGPLEAEAATFERDLIVGNAERRRARDEVVAARRTRAELAAREAALTALAARCVEQVDPAPRYAVPAVEALGPVPVTVSEIGPYRERLVRVGRAMDVAEQAYAAALGDLTRLVDLLDASVVQARAGGVAEHPDLQESERAARAVLARRPVPLAIAEQMVTTYRAWLAKETPR